MKVLAVITILLYSVIPAAAQTQNIGKIPVGDGTQPDPAYNKQTHGEFVQQVYKSVVMLYRQSEAGDMQMTCTATAYRDIKGGYRLASASHCVPGKTQAAKKQVKFFMSLDESGDKTFIPAKLIDSGNKSEGDDFSIFEVSTKVALATVPLGDSSKLEMGDPLINVAAPMGVGKQFFMGYVTITHVDRPPMDAGETKWVDAIMVQIGSGPGSSGSAIVSEDQKAIVGFLVGGMAQGDIGAIVIPVNKFKTFEEAVDKGTYKHRKDADSDDGLPF